MADSIVRTHVTRITYVLTLTVDQIKRSQSKAVFVPYLRLMLAEILKP